MDIHTILPSNKAAVLYATMRTDDVLSGDESAGFEPKSPLVPPAETLTE
jgi:hypothetical protein